MFRSSIDNIACRSKTAVFHLRSSNKSPAGRCNSFRARTLSRDHGWVVCRHPDRVVDPEADKPAEQQVVFHLLHQLPLGADQEQDLQQARPDQPLGRDRGTAEIGVERLELGIEAGERVPHRARTLVWMAPAGQERLG